MWQRLTVKPVNPGNPDIKSNIPVKPGAHIQLKVLSPSTQVASLKHGEESHSFSFNSHREPESISMVLPYYRLLFSIFNDHPVFFTLVEDTSKAARSHTDSHSIGIGKM